MNKYWTTILVLLGLCFTYMWASDISYARFFRDLESDEKMMKEPISLTSSVLTKIYTLDLLYKSPSTRYIIDQLFIVYQIKHSNMSLDTNYHNKYGLVIDPGKTNRMTLEIYNDSTYLDYFRGIGRDKILDYLLSLNKNNDKFITDFIDNAAMFFTNPNFYSAYADYLQAKEDKDTEKVINYLLLGGDYNAAADILVSCKGFSNSQRVKVLEMAQRVNEAYELCLKTDSMNYLRISELATSCGMFDIALSTYQNSPEASVKGLANICEYFVWNKKYPDIDIQSILLNISDNNALELAQYYLDREEYIKGYQFATTRLGSNHELLSTIKSRALIKIPQGSISKDEIKQYVDLGWQKDVYNTFVSAKDYLSAIDVIDTYPASYSDTLLTFKCAAEQTIESGRVTNINEAILLYARANEWNSAGFYAANFGRYQQAIEYYEKNEVKDNCELSRLYEMISDYAQAINYQMQADSTAYARIAELYEKAEMYHQSVAYYNKAGMFAKSASVAEMINPKDFKLLVEAYYALGDINHVIHYLENLFSESSMLAGEYYIKTGNVETYRDKLLDAGKYQEALNTYSIEDNYTVENLNWLIELSIKAHDRSKEISLSSALLKRAYEKIDVLSLDELANAIAIATNIGDNTVRQKFATQLINEKNRIAKEEKEERARLLAEEREEKKRNALFSSIAGVYRWEEMAYISLKTDGSFTMYSKLMNVGYRYGYYWILDTKSPFTVQLDYDNDRFGGGTQTAYVSSGLLRIGTTKYFKD